MRLAVASILASLLAAFVACRHDAGELDPNVQRSAQHQPTSVAADAPRATVRDAGGPKAVSPSRDVTPLLARLAYEAHHRTAVRLPAERVLDALDQAKLRIIERKQFLGATVDARYCLGGRTDAGLAIAACEYEDPAAAEAGKELMDRRFSAMSRWARRSAHGTIVLTIADPSGLAHDELAAHAFEVFAAL